MPTNNAAWLVKAKTPLQVREAPFTRARDNEIVVQNHAVAINPIDWVKQRLGKAMYSWNMLPFILGWDVAGEVVEVGAAVTRFAVGDRVLGLAAGMDKTRNTSAEGAFQRYTVLLAHMATPIPTTMSYEDAAVLPLALSTAACGLFQKDHLALQHPSAQPAATGKTLLVWGGSTSVGSNAIQLAVAAGYEVVTTASPRNFDYVKKLGAKQVFDYHSNSVVEEVVQALSGTTMAGALAIGSGSTEACLAVVGASTGNKFVSLASPAVSFDELAHGPDASAKVPLLLGRLVTTTVKLQVKSRAQKVPTKFINGSSLINNEVGPLIFEDFLPAALAEGRFVPAPAAQVVGTGLAAVQVGFDTLKKGVSAQKVVVSL